jgi:transketolase
MSQATARVERLMALASGDEKHDPSAHSTLDVLWVLYDRVLRVDPRNPRSENRDRFLMSKGHGPIALFAILADKGFFPVEELSRFETWDGILGGHPDRNRVPGIEISTGSLGHGFPMAVGVALALRAKESDRRVFVLIGDGESNEGSVGDGAPGGQPRAPAPDGDPHRQRIEHPTLGDVAAKFRAFGWSACTVDGRDHDALYAALSMSDPTHPTMVVAEIRA